MFAVPPFNIFSSLLASRLSIVDFRFSELRLCGGGLSFGTPEKLNQGKSQPEDR
jgi:hypothetical protein